MTDVKEIYRKALHRHSPDLLVKEALKQHFHFKGDKPLYVLGVGKASVKMAQGMLEQFGDNIISGLIIAQETEEPSLSGPFQLYFASHPIPGEDSVKAGKALIEFIQAIPPNGTLITLISGGTSSLVVQPAEGLSVKDVQEVYRRLVNSGADIYEINTVRKHLSKIKGGQLLRYLNPNVQLIDLIISDVPGDDPEIIGSGLTISDSSTFKDAKSILMKYNLWDSFPDSVRRHIKKGTVGDISETVKPESGPLQSHQTHIIGSAKLLAEAISKEFKSLGYKPVIADSAYNEDVESIAVKMAGEAIFKSEDRTPSKPQVLIYFGESTVNVTGSGKGGRNQELALWAALQIDGHPNITWLSVGTDGIDGPTDAAGAIVDGDTILRAKQKGVDPESYLKNNDSYHFHEQMNTLVKTGPTGNNLMDIQIVVVE